MTDMASPALYGTPGAMEERKSRVVPGGLIEYEAAPAGWLTKAGTPRLKDWRAYYWTPAGKGRRVRLPSVSTLLDVVCPKDGLPWWAEARGIEGAIEAIRRGELDPHDPASAANAVDTVRALRLGADRARDDAADRGINLHALLEHYMLMGESPDIGQHPVEHHGYIRALARWLMKARPEPKAVEQLVCDPDAMYAGRLDLRAHIDGVLTTVDLKTQVRAGIWRRAHLQVGLYERAAVKNGAIPADRLLIVVLAEDGEFREMECEAIDETIDAALCFYREVQPIDSACERANLREREARKTVA